MCLSIARNFAVLVLSVVGIASLSYAGPIVTVPPGLTPGTQYRLVFVTVDIYSATSSSIATYNTDVNNEANNLGGDTGSLLAFLGTTWLDIGSTAAVNAIDNIGQDPGVPIYDLLGDMVANDATAGAGGIFSPSHDIFTTDTGATCAAPGFVWTGTNSSTGTVDSTHGLGQTPAEYGRCSYTGASAIANGQQAGTNSTMLYGISGVLVVPAPEPASTEMVIAGAALLFISRKWFHRNGRATPKLH